MNFFRKILSAIFIILMFSLIVSSLLPQEASHRFFYQAMWFKILWAALSIGLVVGVVNFAKKKLFTLAIIYFGFLFILSGGLLTSFLEEEGFIEIKEGQSVDGFWIEDDLFRPLDFSLYLKDFLVKLYPEEKKGMRFVKSYKTSVSIIKDKKLLKEGVIEVNRPLSFRRFNFYQYGYDENLPNQTILQVVKDPGLPFVYAGYLIVLLGMIFSFKRVFFSI